MDNKEMAIESATICGVINPVLIIKIYGKLDNSKLEIYENSNIIDYTMEKKYKYTYIKVKLNKKRSNLSIVVKNNGTVLAKYKIKNRTIKRILDKYSKEVINFNKIVEDNFVCDDVASSFDIIESRVLDKEKGKKVKLIIETMENNFEFEVQSNGNIIKNNTKKLSDNIYSCSFYATDDNINVFVKKDNKLYCIQTISKSMLCEKNNNDISRYNSFSVIGIQECFIAGVKNSVFHIQGTTIFDNPSFKVLADEVEIEHKMDMLEDKNSFCLEARIPRKSKIIKFLITINNQDILIVLLKNRLISRVIKKLKSIHFYKKVTYFSSPVIGIQECILTGIKNPVFHIQGTTIFDNPNLKVYADKKEVECDNFPLSDDKSFCINAKIPFKTKKIAFYIEINGKNNLIVLVKNKISIRIIQKIKSIFRVIRAKFNKFVFVSRKGIKFLWREHHFLVPPTLWIKYFKILISRLKTTNPLFYNPFDIYEYNKWLEENQEKQEIMDFKYNPLISILIPVYNVDSKYLTECLDSILEQTYKNFEVCLVDDCSKNIETINTLKDYEKKDKRIKVKFRKENGHISKATNDALKMAKGEFIALMDNDDTLSPNALYENVKVLNENNKIDMIYSDEDKLNIKGKYCDPHFKPDFSPDTLMSLNYICHFTVIRKKTVEKVGGFEVGLEGAQDHDLFLKISEITSNIHHISKILYHWRMIPTSTAMNLSSKDYASDKGKIAIENALKRRKLKGTVSKDPVSTYYIVNYKPTNNPLVSIIIPTRDYADTLETCLKSLYEKTSYKNYEVIVVNNNSKEEETFDLFNRYKNKYKNFKVIDANFEFNYSKINNLAVKESKGEYIVLLNNDTEIISDDWLYVMLGYASLPHVGTVGPKLLYPDNTVQHAGVILGLGGVASHAYLFASRDDPGMYGRLRVPYNYSAVTAACLMVQKRKFLEVNGLEEDLMVAYNDIDFNIKLLEKGYANICVPQIELYHFESKSRGLDTTTEKYKRFLKESKYMFNKWDATLINDKYYNPNFAKKYWFMLEKRKEK